MNSVAIGLTDATALLLALAAAGAVRYAFVGVPVALPSWGPLLVPVWWVGALVTGLLPGWGLSAVDHLRRQVMLITTIFCIGAVMMFFTKTGESTSRLGLGAAWGFGMFFVPLGRTMMRHFLCVRRAYGMPTMIFGRASVATEIAARLRADPGLGYVPVGICTDEPVKQIDGVPVVGDLHRVSPLAPAAIVASSGLDASTNHALIERVLSVYRNVTILPDLGDVPSSLVMPRDLTGMVGLEISQSLLSPYATKVKRAIDLVLVLGTMPLWWPIMSTALIAIWMADRKPPVFRQERTGRSGVTFEALKCRTMVPDAEQVLKDCLEANPRLRAEWKKDFKLKNDPRITWLGRFLRRTSIDELPQLINVLRGEMSLVGPRPLPQDHLGQLPAEVRDLRARMRPGLTGLWQVSGRSDVGTAGMTRWDRYYVRNWSLWLDVVIFVRTGRAVILGSGAR